MVKINDSIKTKSLAKTDAGIQQAMTPSTNALNQVEVESYNRFNSAKNAI